MKVTNCPECGCDDLDDHWSSPGRVLRQYCAECYWTGPARIPEQQEIETTKKVSVGQFSGWSYEVYDRYGHAMIFSQTYSTEAKCEEHLLRDLKHHKDREEGPCTGLIFPAYVEVQAKVYDGSQL